MLGLNFFSTSNSTANLSTEHTLSNIHKRIIIIPNINIDQPTFWLKTTKIPHFSKLNPTKCNLLKYRSHLQFRPWHDTIPWTRAWETSPSLTSNSGQQRYKRLMTSILWPNYHRGFSNSSTQSKWFRTLTFISPIKRMINLSTTSRTSNSCTNSSQIVPRRPWAIWFKRVSSSSTASLAYWCLAANPIRRSRRN